MRTRAQEVRRSRKKSFYLRELSSLLSRLVQDEPSLGQLYFNRVELSDDGGLCYVYCGFFNAVDVAHAEEMFNQVRDTLVMYKPSMRKALAASMTARYVPDIRFFYDETKEKEQRVTSLLAQVSQELRDHDRLHGVCESDDDTV